MRKCIGFGCTSWTDSKGSGGRGGQGDGRRINGAVVKIGVQECFVNNWSRLDISDGDSGGCASHGSAIITYSI